MNCCVYWRDQSDKSRALRAGIWEMILAIEGQAELLMSLLIRIPVKIALSLDCTKSVGRIELEVNS